MTKKEVFEYMNSGIDKNGSLKKEIGFANRFHNLYLDYLAYEFPENIKNLPFKQKLWHFLNDVYEMPVCKVCGKPVAFETSKGLWGYRTYCSSRCCLKSSEVIIKRENTCEKKYGAKYYVQSDDYRHDCRKKYETDYMFQSDEFKKKTKMACQSIYGVEHYSKTDEWTEQVKNTCNDRYGVDWSSQLNSSKEKMMRTCMDRYGCLFVFQSDGMKKKMMDVMIQKYGKKYYSQTDDWSKKVRETCNVRYGMDSYSQTSEFKKRIKEKQAETQKKQYDTKKRNHSFTTSSVEREFKDYLISKNIEFEYQYKSDVYPFACDFYVSDFNLYVEIQGTWTHGGHPFNENNEDDLDKLNLWKSKNTKYYQSAIYTWTDLDVRKRRCAEENGLNYLEIFSDTLEECTDVFENHIRKMMNDDKEGSI